MGLFVLPPEPGDTLDMPMVTAPMTGRTVGATTTSSVSPKTSGLSNVFLPRETQLQGDYDKKRKRNPHKKVVPTESTTWDRLPLTEAGFLSRISGLAGKTMFPGKPATTATPQKPIVSNPEVTKTPKPKKPGFALPQLTPAEKKAWGPGRNEPVKGTRSADGSVSLNVDPDYEKAAPHPDAWGKDAPARGPANAEPLPGQTGGRKLQPGTRYDPIKGRAVPAPGAVPAPQPSARTKLTIGGVSAGDPNKTHSLPKNLGTSGDLKAPSGETFVRSASRHNNDEIDPAD